MLPLTMPSLTKWNVVPPFLFPRTSLFMRQNEHRCVKRSIFWPVRLSLEHSLAHDVRPRSLESLFDDAVIVASLTAAPESEAPAETLLKEHPLWIAVPPSASGFFGPRF